MPAPRVSVVMPVRNGERFLSQAVESVRTQTLADLELIAVDDCSTDSTGRILEQSAAADPRIRVVAGTGTGISAALNAGWHEARGDYVARLDADDVAFPERLERQVRFLDAHPDVAVVGSAAIVIDAGGRRLATTWSPTGGRAIRSTLRRRNCMTHPSVLIRRTALEAAGGYRFDHVEDYDLWLRLSERHELANLSDATILYRVHPDQTSFQELTEQVRRAVAVRKASSLRRRGEVDPLGDAVELTPDVVARIELDEREVAAALESEWLTRASLLGELGRLEEAEELVAQAERSLGPRARRAFGAAKALRHAEELRANGRTAAAFADVGVAIRRDPRYTLTHLAGWAADRVRALP
jgi:glycosyltransferase involved in cell wall biosynthesis